MNSHNLVLYSYSSLRDQGFHRARILIVLPTREAVRRTVHQILRLMPKGATVSHRRRFEHDFGPQEGQADREKRRGKKPADYEEWFACTSSCSNILSLPCCVLQEFLLISGNTDDRFRIGIAVQKKSVKLYSAFAESDIVIASPLGLETLINEKEYAFVTFMLSIAPSNPVLC